MSASRWLVLVLIAATVGPAFAEPPAKGFWRILVKPKARWVLRSAMETKTKAKVVVETYDVRKVGVADVARLRWTAFSDDGTKTDWGSSDAGRYTQVAVTDAGLYILSADMDDAAVALALKKKPSRSDPPKAYKGSKQNQGRYLHTDGDEVCVGYEPLPGAGDCPDTCFGEVCFDAQKGPVSMMGTYSPDEGQFHQ